MDNRVYSWGVGSNGELGLGKQTLHTTSPCLIESLRNYSILKIAAGQGFSVFVAKNGMVFTCGSHQSNCLAHKENEDLFVPKLVNSLLKENIFDVSCGANHVVAISSEGMASAWGNNEHGKLGIAELRPLAIEPTKVVVPDNVKFKKVFCGPEATALLDYMGNLWLCGSNRFNKLALNRSSLFGSRIVQSAYAPQRARLPGQCKTNHVAFGHHHTLFFMENGKIVAAGYNQNGQLGVQHIGPVSHPSWSYMPRHHKMKVSSLQ